MFNLFKKSKEQLVAPLSGKLVKIEDVPDPVFSDKIIGEGIAIEPTTEELLAPIDGEVINITPTKHAIGIRTEKGTEVLIHVGLETVSMDGEGFTVHVQEGDQVSTGQPLMTFDLELIRERANSILTPIVITNNQNQKKQIQPTDASTGTAGETVILNISNS